MFLRDFLGFCLRSVINWKSDYCFMLSQGLYRSQQLAAVQWMKLLLSLLLANFSLYFCILYLNLCYGKNRTDRLIFGFLKTYFALFEGALVQPFISQFLSAHGLQKATTTTTQRHIIRVSLLRFIISRFCLQRCLYSVYKTNLIHKRLLFKEISSPF